MTLSQDEALNGVPANRAIRARNLHQLSARVDPEFCVDDGRWVGRLKLPQGGYRYFTGTTQKAVKERLRKAAWAIEWGRPLPNERLTLGGYLEGWLAGLPSTALKPSSVRYYRGYVQLHVMGSELARKPLARLSPGDLQSLYSRKLTEGLSTTTVHHLHAVIHRALGAAYRHGEVSRNVAALLDTKEKPGMGRSPMQALTGDQPEVFLQAIRGEPLEALFTVALTAGLRRGELLGLRWSDVGLDSGVLRVSGSLQRSQDGRWAIGSLKTGKSRVVELAPLAVSALRAHRKRQREAQLIAGSTWEPGDLVFCNEFGRYLNAGSLNRALDRILISNGLPTIRFHDLRHTAATRLLERGVHPKVASEMLGHSSVQVTMDIYSKVTPTIQREAVRMAWGVDAGSHA